MRGYAIHRDIALEAAIVMDDGYILEVAEPPPILRNERIPPEEIEMVFRKFGQGEVIGRDKVPAKDSGEQPVDYDVTDDGDGSWTDNETGKRVDPTTDRE